jgi:protein-S-isoprenylcysteine O-methyltransferase Ste14/uncharacterized membrane protein (UPF0127 family)
MPIIDKTTGRTSPLSVREANNFIGRCVGLLGTRKADPNKALHLVPSSAIHTFGMAYPIDALFLDGAGRVLRSVRRLPPGRVVQAVPEAESVLELPAGAIRKHGLRTGHQLKVVPDGITGVDWKAAARAAHAPVNLFLALLWSRFVLSAFEAWRLGGEPMGLGIVIHNTLLMVFFLTRRNSDRLSLRFADWLVPVLTLGAAMLLRPAETELNGWFGGGLSAWIQAAGMMGIILSLLSLGRSFGVIPANRSVVRRGAYRFVRHPLYMSELIFYFGFVSANATAANLSLVLFITAGQLWRSVAEEKVLSLDPAYRAYRKKVRFRFVPGLY